MTPTSLDGFNNKDYVNLVYNTYEGNVDEFSKINGDSISLTSDNPEEFEALSKNPYIKDFWLSGEGAPDTKEEIEAFKNCESIEYLVINGEEIDLEE